MSAPEEQTRLQMLQSGRATGIGRPSRPESPPSMKSLTASSPIRDGIGRSKIGTTITRSCCSCWAATLSRSSTRF